MSDDEYTTRDDIENLKIVQFPGPKPGPKKAGEFKPDLFLMDIPEDPDEAMIYLNERVFMLSEGGKAIVGRFRYDDILKRSYLERMTTADFGKLMNKPVKVPAPGKGGADTTKLVPAARYWSDNPSRLQFMSSGMYFEKSPRGALNLWRGWAIEPEVGDWELMRKHIIEVICPGDRDMARFVLLWLANLVQNPGQQAETALVMRGRKGIGKGIFARWVGALFGNHYLHIATSGQLTGRFNDHLRDTVVLFADEAFFAGDRAHEGALKALITENTIAIEPKFLPVVTVPNRLHIIMATNEDWAIPASEDERRYAMVDVSDKYIDDGPYFEKLEASMKDGGAAAMLHYLLNVDIAARAKEWKIDLRRPPRTAALADQIQRSDKSLDAWWYDCLYTGCIYEWQGKYIGDDDADDWPAWLATRLFAKSYTAY
jgi:hypothetical protein